MILRCLLRIFGIGGPRKRKTHVRIPSVEGELGWPRNKERGHSIISGAMSNEDIDRVLKGEK